MDFAYGAAHEGYYSYAQAGRQPKSCARQHFLCMRWTYIDVGKKGLDKSAPKLYGKPSWERSVLVLPKVARRGSPPYPIPRRLCERLGDSF